MLLPDDTMKRIRAERRLYLEDAKILTLYRQSMDTDTQSVLIENLAMIDLHERCAQSLAHEFGHIKHFRAFDELGLHTNTERYLWFLDSGYLNLLDLRYPNFANLSAHDKLTELKESFAEDYRISLNLSAHGGMFILPNKVCYQGDFQLPELMYAGVDIMKDMLRRVTEGQAKKTGGQSAHDTDTLAYVKKLRNRTATAGWVAGTKSMTADVVDRDLAELLLLDAEEQVATAAAALKVM